MYSIPLPLFPVAYIHVFTNNCTFYILTFKNIVYFLWSRNLPLHWVDFVFSTDIVAKSMVFPNNLFCLFLNFGIDSCCCLYVYKVWFFFFFFCWNCICLPLLVFGLTYAHHFCWTWCLSVLLAHYIPAFTFLYVFSCWFLIVIFSFQGLYLLFRYMYNVSYIFWYFWQWKNDNIFCYHYIFRL